METIISTIEDIQFNLENGYPLTMTQLADLFGEDAVLDFVLDLNEEEASE